MRDDISVRVEAPLADWPAFALIDGGRAAHIAGRYRAPSGWWQIGFPMLLVMAGFALLPASCSFDGRFHLLSASEAGTRAAIWAAALVVIGVLGRVFGTRRTLDVTLSPETIRIGGKTYARRQGLNQFAIEEHELAFNESRNAQRGHPGRAYRDALQVVMRYGERRIAIAAFAQSDVRKAEALLHRLQGFNVLLDAGAEQPLAPSGESDDFGPERTIR